MIPPRWSRVVDAAARVSARLPSIPHITLARDARGHVLDYEGRPQRRRTRLDPGRPGDEIEEERCEEWHLEREIRARGDRGTCRPSVPHRDGAGMSVASSAKLAVVP